MGGEGVLDSKLKGYGFESRRLCPTFGLIKKGFYVEEACRHVY